MPRSGSLGGGTADRLASRLDRAQLSRQSIPGGGEVWKGPIASRALKALGARAMTVDRSIIVGDDFNPTTPEDQALYAHEQYHVDHADRGSNGHGHDAEEAGAQAVEAMVFHRASSGGYESGYQQSGGTGRSDNAWADNSQNSSRVSSGTQGGSDKPDTEDGGADSQRGYNSMRAQGHSHADVCDDLARRVLAAIDESHQARQDRGSDVKGWM